MSKEPMFMYDNENLVIQSGGTAGYCGIKMKENNKYDLFFLQFCHKELSLFHFQNPH